MANILIVEDDHMNFEMASELLEHVGHKVMRAETGEECLEIVENQKPNLILMDIGLPLLDGLSVTRELKKDVLTREIPVVAFSAMVMQIDKENAFAAGCLGFISKPIEVSSFVSTVESFIKKEDLYNSENQIKLNDFSQNIKKENNNYNNLVNVNNKKIKSHNILVVDDNEMNAEILKETLEQINQKVKLAFNAHQAFEKIDAEKFDLILLDIMMPDVSGYDVIKQLKENPQTSDIPVIFVSALDKTSDIVKGFDLGSYEYIVKPYKIEELKARILSILKIKDLQDELKSEKKILDFIFKFSADGMVLLNPEFEIISCNEIFLKWIEKEKKEILYTQRFCEIVKCECLGCYPDEWGIHSCCNIEVNTNIGKKHLNVNRSKIFTFDGDVEGYVMVLRDTTIDKEIEIQKETFVATLTHDLKTPVRAQTRALQLLLDEKFGSINDGQVEILVETLNSNKYMASMLDNLLSTYKYENGSVLIKKQYIDINSLIKSCYNELKYLTKDKNQQVLFDFYEDNLNTFVDPIEIKRVILNLLSNAINYTDETGEINISTKTEDDKAFISFYDNGKGMSKEEISSLFNKYTSYSKKFRQVGTGLGLYLSKQIVEKHEGDISVESEEGKGSCFTVTLPLNLY